MCYALQEGERPKVNRYSYCLNNPLRYTDPSGELFGIDDAVWIFAAFSAASSAMQAAATGQSVWKAVGISLLSSAASYGIGQAFGSLGGFWNEAARAGAHGLASGLTTSLSGGKFWSGFASGVVSSGMGSFAQSGMMSTGAMIGCCTVMGGLTSWATGGNFWDGAQSGLMIGALNHGLHGDEHQTVIRDGSKVGYQILLDDVVVTQYKVSWSTGIGMAGTLIGKTAKWYSKLKTSTKSHYTHNFVKSYNSNKWVQKHNIKITAKNATIYKGIGKGLNSASKLLGKASAFTNGIENAIDIMQTGRVGLGNVVDFGVNFIPGAGLVYIGADYLYFQYSGMNIRDGLNNVVSYQWR